MTHIERQIKGQLPSGKVLCAVEKNNNIGTEGSWGLFKPLPKVASYSDHMFLSHPFASAHDCII